MNDEMMMRMNPFVPLPQPRPQMPIPMPRPDPRGSMQHMEGQMQRAGSGLTPQMLMELLGSTFNNRGEELKF